MRNHLLLFTLVLFVFTACSPHNDPPSPPNQENVTLDGIIYTQLIDINSKNLCAYDIKQEKVLWKSPVIDDDWNNWTYDEGTIYIGGFFRMIAVDAATGTAKWSLNGDPRSFNGAIGYDKNRAVIKDSLLYCVLPNGTRIPEANPVVYCLKKKTGTIVWAKHLVGENTYGTPAIGSDKIVIVSHVGYNSYIYCLDRFTGAQLWLDNSSFTTHISDFPFCPDDSQVILTGHSNASGIHSLDLNTGHLIYENTSTAILPTMSFPYHGNPLVFFTTGDPAVRKIGKFDLLTRTMSYPLIIDTVWHPTISGDSVFSCDYGYRLKCMKVGVTTPVWQRDLPTKNIYDTMDYPYLHNINNSAPTCDDDILYYYDRITHAGLHFNSLYLFDMRTGKLVKEIKLNDDNIYMGNHLLVVKNGKAYYPTVTWAF